MKFSSIAQKISAQYSIDILSTGNDLDICKISFVDDRNYNYSSDTLYFAYSEIEDLPPHCIIRKLSENNTACQYDTNIASVNQSDFFAIFNYVQSLIETSKQPTLYEELRDIYGETNDLQLLLNIASSKLNNPLVLLDQSYRIVGYSSNFPIQDSLFQKYITQGYCDFNLMRYQNNYGLLKTIHDSNEIYLDNGCIHSPSQKLFQKITNGNKNLGLLIMLCEHSSVSSSHYKNLKTVKRIISQIAYKYLNQICLLKTPYEMILNYLLIGATSDEIKPYMKGLNFSKYLSVLVIVNENRQLKVPLNSKLQNQLINLFPNIHTVIHKDSLVVLFPLDKDMEILSEQMLMLNVFAKSHSLKIGISHAFTDFLEFLKHFQQAYAAIKFQRIFLEQTSVSQYKHFQFFHLLSEIKNTSILKNFGHPALKLLKKYDSENNTELYNTLHAFIKHSNRVKETAKSLFIHRNSLNYRIERIKQITGINLQDSETVFLLMTAYLIDAFLHNYVFDN